MRKTHPFLRCALAATLACGLMVPATALTAFADAEKSPTPPLATDVGAETDGPSSDGESATPADVTAALGDLTPRALGAGAPATREAQTAGDFTVVGGKAATSQTAGDGDYFFEGTTLHILTSTPLTVSTAAQTAHNIEINAGVKADLTLAGVNISTTLAPINLVTNSDEDGDGKKVTNANQIKEKTMLYLTLADGTTNNLTCGNQTTTGAPAIRCGWGSILVIDDGITNVRAGGSKFNLDDIVTPENGAVPRDVTLIGGTDLASGDPLIKMEAAEAGILNAQGGGHSAGIGSAANENAGTIIINGGTIVSRACPLSAGWGNANGAGIGSGSGGSGTVMIFNGGNVSAYASSCGAGIGSALGYNAPDHIGGVPKSDAIDIPKGETLSGGYSFIEMPSRVPWFCCSAYHQSCPHGAHYLQATDANTYFTVAGDITVNGGFVSANSGEHGNAFGQSCAHGPSSNYNHIVRVTGGTLLTNTYDINSGNPPRAALGALFGYTIVTGGSVMVQSKSNGKPAFQGIGGTAFNTQGIENWDDVEEYKAAHGGAGLPDTDKVFMLTVNLKNSDEKMTDEKITKFNLYIGGKKQNYGAPAQFVDGKLYLWLPEWAADPDAPQEVRIEMSVLKDGKSVPIDPLFITKPDASNPDQTAKRWIEFDFPVDYQKYLTKDYDGLPFDPLEVSAENPIIVKREQGDNIITETLDNGDDVKFKYQMLKQNEAGEWVPDGLESAEGAEALPADTGRFSVTMISYEYAKLDNYKDSYWGHQAKGTAVINPVPAVLEIEGVEWGHLDVDSGTWQPIVKDQTAGGVAGNRLKLTFNIRSANTTALTCKAPTGSFQVRIDGKKVGDPIKLTAEAFAESPHSTIEEKDITVKSASGGTETRHATVVTYYLDPANRDGLLDLLESAGNGDEHKVNLEYLADKNYIQGVDKNPDNASEDDAFIVPVPPQGDVKPDGSVSIEDTKPTPPGPGTDPDDPADKTKVIRKTITASYAAFHDKTNPDLQDFFALALESSSSVKPTYAVSNAAVADLKWNEDGTPALDENGKLQVEVNSCGTSVITVEQKPNALYTGIKYILTVNVLPDPAIKPEIQIRLTWRNITAIKEAESAEAPAARLARALVAVPVDAGIMPLAVRATTDRTHTPPRPGDELEYTVTGLNLTNGSAWQAAELKDAIDQKLTLDAESVEIAPNYATRTDKSTALGSDAFYEGFNWAGLDWTKVPAGGGDDGYEFDDATATLSKMIGSVYGGQSTSVRFRATVADDLGKRPGEDGKLPEITNKPAGDGSYGKPENDPGDTTKPTPLDPDKDIDIIGGIDPKPGEPSAPEPIPVLPKDPAAPDITTTVEVEQKAHTEEHDDDRILVGDTLGVTVTSTNHGKDSCLTDAIVKVTLPQGMEPKEGTIKLVDGAGVAHDVPFSAYDPKTGVIAVNAGDLYGGESAVLTFDVEVVSVHDPDNPDDPSNPDSPDNPSNPDDPDNPGTPGDPTPGRPTDPVIEGGTLGGTPTDEWEREHPTDPDVEPADPADKPKPGTPFVPTAPWEDLEEEFVTPDPVQPVMPPVLPANPKLEADEGGPADITVKKTAENLDSADGTTHVGDVIRYSITVENAKANTIWYDVVIRDDVPVGLEPMAGSLRLTDRAGTVHEVPDDAYDVEARRLAVTAGDLRGPGSITLTFDALVTEEAAEGDIGNVAEAFGTTPSGVDTGTVGGEAERPMGGKPFVPEDGWDAFEREHPTLSNPAPTYPAGVTDKGGVITEPRPEPTPDGAGDVQGDKGSRTPIRLAQTGDELVAPSVALVAAAAALGLMLTALAAQRRRQRETLVSRHRGQW